MLSALVATVHNTIFGSLFSLQKSKHVEAFNTQQHRVAGHACLGKQYRQKKNTYDLESTTVVSWN